MRLAEGCTWLITEGGNGLGIALAEKLSGEGHRTIILNFPNHLISNQWNTHKMIDIVNLSDTTESHLKKTLSTIQEKFGQIGGFIHFHPSAKTAASISDLFREDDKEIVKFIFLIAKHLKDSLNATAKLGSNAYFVTVTQFDGHMGTSGEKAYSILGGGLSGLVKSLHREWANVYCRHIDLEPSISSDKAVNIVTEEIADPDTGLLEVGRTKTERMTLTLESIKTVAYNRQETPDSHSVFLVSGGGRGITADCVVELAVAYKSKFVLLGRTALQPWEPDWAKDCTDENELKKRIVEDFTQKGKKLTPVEVNKVLSSLRSQREIKATLVRVKSCGGEAIYISADVTNKAELAKQLEGVEENIGVITGIIHGAGNIADKRIEKKSQEDFHQVLEPKIKGLENLLSIFNPEKLKYLFLFSSVAGYFGNAGQTDYAVANEILNKFAYSFKYLFPKSRVVSINWGPWERGMIDPTLKTYYQQQKIDLIPVEVGVKFCRDEFMIANDRAVEQIVVSGSLSIPTSASLQNLSVKNIRRIIEIDDNPFLKDHVIGNNAVLPATCAVNWMVKSCEDVLTNYKVRVIENFKVFKGIIFEQSYNNEYLTNLDIENIAHPFEVKISNQPKGKNNFIYSYGAKLSFEKEWSEMPIYKNLDIQADGKSYAIYGEGGVLFHGQTFQGIKKVLHLNERKITSLCNLRVVEQKQQGQFSVNSFNPYLADVQLHNVLLWTYHQLGEGCLPMGFEKIEQFQPLNFEQDFYVSTEIISSNINSVTANVFVHNEDGEIYIQWTNISYYIVKKLQALFWGK